jgi:hypothetical protein
VQRQIESALGGINIIVETIGPWKSIASFQTLPPGTRNVRAGGLAAHIEQRIASGGSNGRDEPLLALNARSCGTMTDTSGGLDHAELAISTNI